MSVSVVAVESMTLQYKETSIHYSMSYLFSRILSREYYLTRNSISFLSKCTVSTCETLNCECTVLDRLNDMLPQYMIHGQTDTLSINYVLLAFLSQQRTRRVPRSDQLLVFFSRNLQHKKKPVIVLLRLGKKIEMRGKKKESK